MKKQNKRYPEDEVVKYVKDVLKQTPYYRHYAEDVKSLLRLIKKLKKELK
jgi:hypothetical protein